MRSCSARISASPPALTSASIAALTLYDMAKSVDKSMEILSIHLVEKTGGNRGDFRRNE
jgi:cyclic pyranopterin phosphate synthase